MSQASLRRVVVTGMGAVTPLGLTVEELWKGAVEGRSGIGPITRFDATLCPVRIAGEVKNFPELDTLTSLPKKESKKLGRFAHLGIAAAVQAFRDSGLGAGGSKLAPERMGVNIGVGMGGLPEIQSVYDDFREKGYRRITPFFIVQSIPNTLSGQVSILLNLRGPNHCNTTACATSTHSIGESMRTIQRGEADVMVAGGAEAVVCELGVGGFAVMHALSSRNDDPAKASRPFDRDRDGFVLSEGSSVLVLEELEQARKRGARIYGEIVGYAATGDAYHITSPSPGAEGAGRAMTLALVDAHLAADAVGYINAHSTSTPAGDIEEAQAISRVFGRGRMGLHISATKSMTGHLLGAAGATGAILSLKALEKNTVPPTINLDALDPACAALGLNFTANAAVSHRFEYAMANSFGFGGTNGTLIFGRV